MENQTATEQAGSTLYDPRKKVGQLVKIECKNCGYIGDPCKWTTVTLVGVAYFILGLNILVLIFILLLANPYICVKCNERNKLVKILNNGKKIAIKSLSRKSFTSFSIAGLVIIGAIFLFVLMLSA